MIRVKTSGSFNNINKFLDWAKKKDIRSDLIRIGETGKAILAASTPKDTGLTANSWGYVIEELDRGYRLSWTNSNVVDGAVVALLIQYGHATGTGGYVAAVDYINPVMQPLFGEETDNFWEEVKNA